jgi:hypothetical protein
LVLESLLLFAAVAITAKIAVQNTLYISILVA